jgi:hypothetical protein
MIPFEDPGLSDSASSATTTLCMDLRLGLPCAGSYRFSQRVDPVIGSLSKPSTETERMSEDRSKHEFTCDFGGGVKATATIDVDALRRGRGQSQFLLLEWVGKPNYTHTAAYRAWMLSVQQQAAELLPGRILWAFRSDQRTTEHFALEPGQPPKSLSEKA